MRARQEVWLVGVVVIGMVTLTTLHYLFAARAGGTNFVFGGFLLNPLDGNSYLAKMMLGWRGEWRFTLPYTAEMGKGAYLFLFYLALGHLARLGGISLLLTFHLTRLVGIVFMLVSLYRFFAAVFSELALRRLAFILAAFGSGLGWLAAFGGGFTADFWVAEAFPFLSAYANPHFPFGLALLLMLFTPEQGYAPSQNKRIPLHWRRFVFQFIISFSLGIILPFGVVIALVVLSGEVVWKLRKSLFPIQTSALSKILCLLLGGGAVLAYDIWMTRSDPLLAGWNAQNLTPAPPLWDFLLSFSPLLLFWMGGGVLSLAFRRRLSAHTHPISAIPQLPTLLLWAGLGILLLYAPFGLQRRLMMGLYVPLSGLAVWGWHWLATRWPRRRRLLTILLFSMALPTNILVLMAARHGIQTHDAWLYLTKDEDRALRWMAESLPPPAVILAAPQTGLFIPARSGRRVLYGHPFETVNAARQEELVGDFFRGSVSLSSVLSLRSVDYVFVGPREQALGGLAIPELWQIVYQNDSVTIYRLEP